MRCVVQRVSSAQVDIDAKTVGQIAQGLMVLVGFEAEDNEADLDWMTRKLVNMRIFQDDAGHMNLSLLDVQGDALLVSQFTLHASTKKGNRPSFIKTARPETAIPLYEKFIENMKQVVPGKVATGEFGAMMNVSLVNSGPVTIVIDSRNRE